MKGDGIEVMGTNREKEKKVVNLTLVIKRSRKTQFERLHWKYFFSGLKIIYFFNDKYYYVSCYVSFFSLLEFEP